LLRHREALREAAACGPILDLACGRGRHSLAAAAWRLPVVAADRDAAALASLAAEAQRRELRVDAVRTDLERPNKIPFKAASCGVILVFRFLFRPLAPEIESLLRPGGLLLYETFTRHQSALSGGPRRREFLLEDDELPELFPGLEVIESWQGVTEGNKPAALARFAARRPAER
jgi:SAM-dependent methyltransferase